MCTVFAIFYEKFLNQINLNNERSIRVERIASCFWKSKTFIKASGCRDKGYFLYALFFGRRNFVNWCIKLFMATFRYVYYSCFHEFWGLSLIIIYGNFLSWRKDCLFRRNTWDQYSLFGALNAYGVYLLFENQNTEERETSFLLIIILRILEDLEVLKNHLISFTVSFIKSEGSKRGGTFLRFNLHNSWIEENFLPLKVHQWLLS